MRSGLKGTFSIVAADVEAGEVGCAVQSRYFAVGSVVPWAKAGVGAVATQAAGVAAYGPKVLALLEEGLEPAAALDRALADDRARETRQLGVVTADGRAAAHTGADCLPWAGHRVGDGYAVQGNILAGEAVVTEMERVFLETSGASLAERLVSALESAQAAGGDRRGQQSSAIVVERAGAAAESREGIDRICELRVDDHPEPIVELRRLLGTIWSGTRSAAPASSTSPASTRRGSSCSARRWAATARIRCSCTTWRASSRSPATRRRRSRTSPDRSSSTRSCGRAPPPTPTSKRSGRTRASSRRSARLACGLDLYEYQGKELFRRAGIPVSDGKLATTAAEARAAAEELGERWS